MPKNQSSVAEPLVDFASHFLVVSMQALRDGLGAECTITCSGQEFKLRKSILAAQSPLFRDLFDNKKTKVNAILDLSDDDPTAIAALVDWGATQQPPAAVRRLPLHSHVFILANKYDVPGLRALALKHFSEMINDFPGHVERSLFHHAVSVIYRNTTPEKGRQLRSLLVNALARHGASDNLAHRRAMETLWADVPSLATDLCGSLCDELVKRKAGQKVERIAHFISFVVAVLLCLWVLLKSFCYI
ncbi:uncharacterized protein F5Z01DRAFT_697321 [Emericellopsis atlantica]|uniref:BTB domain-containing protein n=1 Tax=Emericellopsis atlantica TaxID=2614577 RepID=A0A9P7ZRN7_9HYPO|nr:uncharacterized protein F5Z01DRAFT_697321 [Emericellopsis atlantica]KAG9256581.1 hypothetical protein F5Z01DRAFT_697321 [Emericellopsis atlantica]